MRIEHVAIWVENLEDQRAFYEKYFAAQASEKYRNPRTRFESYFLSFESGGRLELMHRADIGPHDPAEHIGLAHLAFSVGSRQRVDEMTRALQRAGLTLLDGPRETGDGYYESCLLDPEGNRLEVTV